MSELPRLNGVIAALEAGKTAFTTFSAASMENAQALSSSPYDGVVFEMEHNPFDVKGLRDTLQYMLSRKQLVDGGTLAPAVTPIVRIPPNGSEQNQWLAKQVLDVGVYGVVWPHVSTVGEAYNAVSASRYPRPLDRPYLEPRGQRGDAPVAAARYWGISQQEYYQKADVWPLNPQGEILVIIMCEEVKAIGNLPASSRRCQASAWCSSARETCRKTWATRGTTSTRSSSRRWRRSGRYAGSTTSPAGTPTGERTTSTKSSATVTAS